jgi:hypothetical protein
LIASLLLSNDDETTAGAQALKKIRIGYPS